MRVKINTVLLVLISIMYSCPSPNLLTLTEPNISYVEEKMNVNRVSF